MLIFEKEHLPEGWIRTDLLNVLNQSKRKFDPKNEKNQPFVGLEHIESNSRKIIGKANSKDTKSTKNVFSKGDILYGKLRPYLNKVAIPDFNGVCSTDILVFQQNDNLVSKYIMLFLSTSQVVRFANRNMTGVQHPRIKYEKLAIYSIPLPPLNEQKRIVTKIESIFTQIDAAQNKLEALASQIKSSSGSLGMLRSSVLKQAFEGKLVSQDPADEPAEMLLRRLHKSSEKELIFEKENLPEGWIKINLEDIVEIWDRKRIPVNSSERKNRTGNIPYYGATGQVGLIDDYIFDEELVLLGEDGAPFFETFKNKAYIVNGKSWVNNHAHVLKGISGLLINKFLCHYLNQVNYHGYVTGTTRLKLNQTAMKTIPVLLSPFNEQKRIVSKIESIFDKIDVKQILYLIKQKITYVNNTFIFNAIG